MIALALLGCLDRMLESPYVLTAGLGEVRSLSPDGKGHFVLATRDGVVEVAADGKATPRTPGPAYAVSSDSDRVYVLREGTVDWDRTGIRAPGAVDILRSRDDELLVLTPDRLEAIDATTGARSIRAEGLTAARALAIGPEGRNIVVTATALISVGRDGRDTIAEGLIDARAAAMDAAGRWYVVAGAPPQLWRVDSPGAAPVLIARWLGDARDIHFGTGDAFTSDTLYIATGTGSLDYLRPPP